MHRGRQYPQPKRRYLSGLCDAKHFAPQRLSLTMNTGLAPPWVGYGNLPSDDVIDHYPEFRLSWVVPANPDVGSVRTIVEQRIPPSGMDIEFRITLDRSPEFRYSEWVAAPSVAGDWPVCSASSLKWTDEHGNPVPSSHLFFQCLPIPYY